MSEEELDEEWESYLRDFKNVDKIPSNDWTDDEWEKYGKFLFSTYNEAHPSHSNPEDDNEN
jgi:Na+-transporting NADH:ubiquinone oxidoreductase subunit NqrF